MGDLHDVVPQSAKEGKTRQPERAGEEEGEIATKARHAGLLETAIVEKRGGRNLSPQAREKKISHQASISGISKKEKKKTPKNREELLIRRSSRKERTEILSFEGARPG